MHKRIARPFAVLVLVMAMLGLGVEPAAAAVPSAPVFFDAFEAPGEAGFIWQAPTSNGGLPITSYIVEVEGLVIEDTPQAFEIIPGFYGIAFYGLFNGFSYEFSVRAVNADGAGPAMTVTLTPNGCTGTPFSDVLQSNTFCDEIAWLTQTGITQGTDTGFSLEFRPTTGVSRQAMAAFLHRFFGDVPSTLPTAFFADVPASHQFYDDIQWMAETGLSTGTPQPGGKPLYKPSDLVSRAAMAAFIHRAAGSPPSGLTEPFFADVSPSHPFYEAIQWMGASGISTGTPQSGGKPLYKPGSSVTREAMAAFLFRFDAWLASQPAAAEAPEALTPEARAGDGSAATTPPETEPSVVLGPDRHSWPALTG